MSEEKKDQLEVLKDMSHTLDMLEAQRLIEAQDEINKLLDKTYLAYQLELTKWTYRWKEEVLYRSMETISELKETFKWLIEEYQKQKKQQDEKQNKKKN